MEKKEKREYIWFVEPLDSNTNMTIAQQLPEENFGRVKCEDEKKHNLWRCSVDFVLFLQKSKESLDLDFRIYNKERTQGKIRNCAFLFERRKRKRTKAVK